MLGFNEIKLAEESINSSHIEKDLNSPIMKDVKSNMENVESPNEHHDGLLTQDELNRPLHENDKSETNGLSEEQKQDIKEKTNWSSAILDFIVSQEEVQVYMEADLEEVDGNLERSDIDWNAKIPQDRIDRMRSMFGDEVANKWENKTNLDLIKDGKAPYGPDGERINLHHIGQKPDSPLAELTNTEHKQYDGILHDKTKISEIERPVFRTEREQYWKARYEAIQQK